jgi:hypothetical protein
MLVLDDDDEAVREGCDLPYVLRTAGLDASVSAKDVAGEVGTYFMDMLEMWWRYGCRYNWIRDEMR